MTPKKAARMLAQFSRTESDDPATIVATELAELLEEASCEGNGKRGDKAYDRMKMILSEMGGPKL